MHAQTNNIRIPGPENVFLHPRIYIKPTKDIRFEMKKKAKKITSSASVAATLVKTQSGYDILSSLSSNLNITWPDVKEKNKKIIEKKSPVLDDRLKKSPGLVACYDLVKTVPDILPRAVSEDEKVDKPPTTAMKKKVSNDLPLLGGPPKKNVKDRTMMDEYIWENRPKFVEDTPLIVVDFKEHKKMENLEKREFYNAVCRALYRRTVERQFLNFDSKLSPNIVNQEPNEVTSLPPVPVESITTPTKKRTLRLRPIDELK